jgi:hypothetical protein
VRAVRIRDVTEALSVSRDHVERALGVGDLDALRIRPIRGDRPLVRVVLNEKFSKWAGAPVEVLFPRKEVRQ